MNLGNNHPILIYENIDDFKGEDEDNKTIGFVLALKRVKTICGIDLGRYQQYLADLATLRNRIQHFKFSVDDAYCQKIMVQSFSAIEHIVLSVLKRQFDDFDDVISKDQIKYLHEDKAAYEAPRNHVGNARQLITPPAIYRDIVLAQSKQTLDHFFVAVPCSFFSFWTN